MTATTSTTLSAPGPRNKVPIEEAQTILTTWNSILSNNASANPPVTVTTLDLSCRSWSLPVLTVLEPALMEIAPTVRTLKIDDVIASLPTEDGFATLAFFNRVFHPDLAECVTDVDLSDNALGTRSLDHIGDLLQRSPRLAHLKLHNCGMSKEVAQHLSEKLGPTIAPQLQSLHLGRNQMGPEGATHFGNLLQSCTSLRSLSYAGSRPLANGTKALVDGLVRMAEACDGGQTSLVELDLDDMNFGTGSDEDTDALLPLCTVIRSSPNLRRLNVKDGGLGQEGFDILVDALVEKGGSKLEYLDVGCLDLEVDGAKVLARYIADHCQDTLVALHIETNMIEDEGLKELLPVLVDCSELRVLNISENGLEEEGFAALAETKIPTLEKLYMKENMEEDIDDDDVKEKIRSLYKIVLMADDDEEKEDDEDTEPAAAVAADAADEDSAAGELADAIGSLQI